MRKTANKFSPEARERAVGSRHRGPARVPLASGHVDLGEDWLHAADADDWVKKADVDRRLIEPIGTIPPTEAETNF